MLPADYIEVCSRRVRGWFVGWNGVLLYCICDTYSLHLLYTIV